MDTHHHTNNISQGVNVVTALEYALKLMLLDAAHRSTSDYKSRTNRLIAWLVQTKRNVLSIQDINGHVMQFYLDSLVMDGGVGKRTYMNHRSYLITLFQRLVTRGFISANPMTSTEKKRYCDPGYVPLTKSEVAQVIEHCGQRMQSFCDDDFIFSTGLKPGTVQIFSTRIQERFKTAREEIGLNPKIKLYRFKDTCIDRLLDKGVDIATIQCQAGHETPEQTLYYARKKNQGASKVLKTDFAPLI